MTILIRPPVLADAPAMAEVHVRAWQAGYAQIAPADALASLSVEDRTDFWRRVLADPSAAERHRVGEFDGLLAGWVAIGQARDVPDPVGEVWALNVHPDHWSRGVGHALMEEAVELLLGEHDTLILWVAEHNHRARTFYERLGWRPDGERKREQLWGITFDEVRYCLDG